MSTYIIKRVLISILIVFIVSVFCFSLLHVMPGDPARLALGYEASDEDVRALQEEMNLDKPIVTQYLLWLKGMFQGDMGRSVIYKQSVASLISARVPRTVSVGLIALVISAPLGILIGVICAVKRGKVIDQVLTFIQTVFMGMPVFWLGILGIVIFAVKLRWLPMTGYVPLSEDVKGFTIHAIMPVACMAIGMIAGVARQTRTNMLDSINQDYVRTARANGLSETSVIYKHALKNALIPVITIIGMQVRVVIGGSLLVEQTFNIAGLGSLLTFAINNRDYLIVQDTTLLIALFTVVANFVVDLLYGVVDPRIRKSRR